MSNVSAAAPKNRSDLVAEENAHQGTRDWMLTHALVDPDNRRRSSRIEGYASKPSVRPGESLKFKVSTRPASPFTIDIYRTGYYQGTGGRHMTRLGRFEGFPQEDPRRGERLAKRVSAHVRGKPRPSSPFSPTGLAGFYLALIGPRPERLFVLTSLHIGFTTFGIGLSRTFVLQLRA